MEKEEIITPLNIDGQLREVVTVTGRGDIYVVYGIRDNFECGMHVAFKNEIFIIKGVELIGQDRGILEHIGLVLVPIAHKEFRLEGKHWLMQGDALEKMKLIPSGSVNLVLADIPFGTTRNKWDTIIEFEPMWEQIWRILTPNGCVCLFAQTPFDKVLGTSQIKHLKYEWIWQKNKATGFPNANRMPLKSHENILVFYKNTPTYNPQKTFGHKKANSAKRLKMGANYGSMESSNYIGDDSRYPLSILPIPVINNDGSGEDRTHPTQKPIPLMEHFIKSYTNEGDTVCDFAMGSGPTIKAAVKLGRFAIGIDNGKCEKVGHKSFGMDWTEVVVSNINKFK